MLHKWCSRASSSTHASACVVLEQTLPEGFPLRCQHISNPSVPQWSFFIVSKCPFKMSTDLISLLNFLTYLSLTTLPPTQCAKHVVLCSPIGALPQEQQHCNRSTCEVLLRIIAELNDGACKEAACISYIVTDQSMPIPNFCIIAKKILWQVY